MTIPRWLPTAAIASAIALASAPAHAGNPTVMHWTIDGQPRKALVFAPTANAARHPVVFAFHGHGAKKLDAIAKMFGIHKVWPEAIVVYPLGVPSWSCHDPQAQRRGWQIQAGQNGDRDLKLFDAMLATMHQKFTVDDARVYVTGFSNGAVFAYLLWARRGAKIAAVAVAAGRLWPSEQLTQRRALLAIAGRNDTVAPLAGRLEAIDMAKQVDQATGSGQSCGTAEGIDANGTVEACDATDHGTCTKFSSPDHTPVEVLIHCDGHMYPKWGASRTVPFFKAHTLPAGAASIVPPVTDPQCLQGCEKQDSMCMSRAHSGPERGACAHELERCRATCPKVPAAPPPSPRCDTDPAGCAAECGH